MNENYKLAIIVRNDLGMSKGKIIAQTGHAMVDAIVKASRTNIIERWRKCGETIIALKVNNEKTLMNILNIARKKKVAYGYIVDEGRTEVPPCTTTLGYVGPDIDDKIDKLVGQLKLL